MNPTAVSTLVSLAPQKPQPAGALLNSGSGINRRLGAPAAQPVEKSGITCRLVVPEFSRESDSSQCTARGGRGGFSDSMENLHPKPQAQLG